MHVAYPENWMYNETFVPLNFKKKKGTLKWISWTLGKRRDEAVQFPSRAAPGGRMGLGEDAVVTEDASLEGGVFKGLYVPLDEAGEAPWGTWRKNRRKGE